MRRHRPRMRSKGAPLLQWTFSLRLGKGFWMAWLVIVLAFLGFSFWGENGFWTAWRLRDQRKALEEENLMLRGSNDRLRQDISMIQSDSSVLEWIARTRLGMIGDGEWLYVFEE